jgi:2-iminobutanoate/2-iminopropanoate deaminase
MVTMTTTTTPEHPYSPAYVVNDHAYVSGALSIDQHGVAVPGRTEAMAAALARMEERLATAQMGLPDVVKLTYFVTDVTLRAEANVQLMSAFDEPRPARSFVEVAALPYGASVEIEAVAVRRSARG